MALDNFANFARGTLSSTLAAGATSVALTAGHGARMPAGAANYVIWNLTDFPDPSDDTDKEIVRGTISSDTLTSLTRGVEGTSDVNHTTGGKTYGVMATLTAKTLVTDLAATYAALGTSPSFTGLTVSGLTADRVPITGTGGLFATDANLRWDPTGGYLGIGLSTAPNKRLLVKHDWTVTTLGAVDHEVIRATTTSVGAGTVTEPHIAVSAWANDGATATNKTITGAANNGSGLIRITATSHGYATGDAIGIYGVVGTTEANSAWIVTVINANTFDLQGSTFTNAYVSGGTATNRSQLVGVRAIVQPTLARLQPGVGTAFNDDVNCYTGQNSGTQKATDGFYLAGTAALGGASAWYTSFSTSANSDYFFRADGIAAIAGLDFASATMTGPAIALANGHRLTIGSTAPTTVTSRVLNTDATLTVGAGDFGGTVTKNDTNVRVFPMLSIKPTLNTGASNTNTQVNVLDIDTVNTAVTGLTVNLFQAAYGGGIVSALNSEGKLHAVTFESTGNTLNTDANGTVMNALFYGSLTKNDANTRSFAGAKVLSTLNAGASNANTTYNVLELDTVNTATTGVTTNLISAGYGGTNRFSVDSIGNAVSVTEAGGILGHILYGTGGASTVHVRRLRGTVAGPQRIQSGDAIGSMAFAGAYNDTSDADTAGTVFGSNVAATRVVATQTFTSTAQGAKFEIRTIPIGSTSIATRATFDEWGVRVGSSIASRSITQGTNQVEIYNGTAPDGTLANGVALYATAGELLSKDAEGRYSRPTRPYGKMVAMARGCAMP